MNPELQTAAVVKQAVRAVDGDQLWRDLRDVASLGGRSDGGVGRLALDDNDVQARLWLAERARRIGCTARVDPLGNLFLRREGADPTLAPVVTGSHVDSQPAGGAYDGIYGVLGGLAVLEALHRSGMPHRHAIEVVAWTNEEGVRFAPGTTGSSGFVGERSLEDSRRIAGTDGVTFGEAVDICITRLTKAGVAVGRLGSPIHAFVELHIEQGPVLEGKGIPIGVVSAIQGVTWFRFTVHGMSNHAGTTPRASRKDAFEGAVALASVLREAACEPQDITRFTVGRFQIMPDSINTIPGTVIFTVDLRDPDERRLADVERRFMELASRNWAGCSIEVERISKIHPVTFPRSITRTIAEAAQDVGLAAAEIVSGAFHDSMFLARHCPTGMIFIPCAGGLSHHPAESITQEHAAAGTRVLAAALLRLAS